jgi:D-proline reductase (dithiol) PrdB
VEILENRAAWEATFNAGWLAHFHATGETKWDLYNRPDNKEAPAGQGIDLSRSRLLLISSAGGYLRHRQEPFNAPDPLGDYAIRTFPVDTDPAAIAFAHDHYDHSAVNEDQQVLLPLAHLRDLVAEGVIGELAPSVVSFMGYQPVIPRVLDQTIPALLAVARAEKVDGALLVPS